MKATIPVRPTVDLGDYQAVRIETQAVEVDDARVDETIEVLRRRAATHEPIERALGWRDIARIDLRAEVDGEPLVQQQEAEVQLSEERDVLFPGFEEQLIGHAKGAALEFDLAVPDDLNSEKFAGKQAHFAVNILETKEEVLPELDEEFAKAVGEGFESVDALRDRIRQDIEKAEQERLDEGYHDQILTKLVEGAAIEFPPVMLDSEVDRLLHDQAGHTERGEALERYLAAIGRTEDQVRAELQPIAELRLRRSLVLSKVADAENIEVTPDEVESEIETLTSSAGAQGDRLRELFGSPDGRGTIRRNLLTRKTLARLVEIATQDAGKAAPEAEPPKRKKRAKKSQPDVVQEEAAAEAQDQADTAQEEETQAAATAETHATAEREDPHDHPVRHRDQRAWRARIRHLLAAAPRAHHLPRHGHR